MGGWMVEGENGWEEVVGVMGACSCAWERHGKLARFGWGEADRFFGVIAYDYAGRWLFYGSRRDHVGVNGCIRNTQ